MLLPFNKTLIIVPTYNEIQNIDKMLNTIKSLYPEVSILIIDDGSPDGTADVVRSWLRDDKSVHLIEREGKLGLGTAYITGFKWALKEGYEYVFEMDCDFSHDPKDIPTLLKACAEEKAKLAIGSRYIGGIRIINWPMHRLLLSYFAGIYTRVITGLKVLDATGGFKCFTREALEALDLDTVISNGYSFQIELNYKVYEKNMKILEVPITFTERRDGESKMSSDIVFEAVFAVLKLRWKKVFGNL